MQKRRKRKIAALLFAFLFGLLFFFRDPLTSFGIDLVMKSVGIHVPLNYEKLEWKGGRCVLSHVSLHEKELMFDAEELSIGFNFHLYPFFSEADLLLKHPQITLLDGEHSSFALLTSLLPARFFQLKLDVEEGTIQFVDGMPPLYFSFQSKKEKGGIGSLLLQVDPASSPLLAIDCAQKEGQIQADVKMEKVASSDLTPLLRCFYPELIHGLKELGGEVEMQARGNFTTEGEVQDLSLVLSLSKLTLAHPDLGIKIDAEEIQGTFSLPKEVNRELPIWKQVLATLSLKEGNAHLFAPLTTDAWNVQDLSATLLLDREQEPVIQVKGTVETGDISCPIDLKGHLRKDGAAAFDLSSYAPIFGSQRHRIQSSLILQKSPLGYSLLGEAHLQSIKQEEATLVFGCDWLQEGRLVPVRGWFRSEKLLPIFYTALLHKIDPSLFVEAELDLIATFDREKLELSLQADDLVFRHPLVDLFIPHLGKKDPHLINLEGRARFVYGFQEGKVEGVIPLFDGKVKEKESGLVFERVSGECQLNGKEIHVENFSAVSSGIPFEGRLHLSLSDEKIKTLSLENAAAQVRYEGKNYQLKGKKLWIKMGEKRQGGFDFGCFHENFELLHFTGTIQEKNPKIFSVMSQVSLAHLPLEGLFKTELLYNLRDERLAFLIDAQKLQVGEKPIATFHVKGEKSGEEWKFDELIWDKLKISGRMVREKARLLFPLFTLKTDQLSLSGSFGYEWMQGRLSSELNATFHPSNWTLPCKIEGSVKEKDQLFEMKNIQLSFPTYASSCLIEEGTYHLLSGKSDGKRVHFSFTPAFLAALSHVQFLPKWLSEVKKSESMSGTFDCQFALPDYAVRAHLKDGEYLLADHVWEVKEPILQMTQAGLHFGCKTHLHKTPLLVTAKVDFASAINGIVKVQDSLTSEGLKLSFSAAKEKEFKFESIRGALSGLEMQFERQESGTLFGTARIDFLKLARLLTPKARASIEQLKIGRGFELTGELSFPLQFRGDLHGKEIEFLGCAFQEMRAEIEFDHDRALVRDFVLDDLAGRVEIKLLRCEKEKKGESWHLFAPLVHAHEIKPSALKKIGSPPKEKKPLLIKNLTLRDLNGELQDPKTLRATGNLNFVNAYKKEFSLLDIPFELIKDAGLDPGLFTPIYGEIDLELKGGKFYLVSLTNTYSEGKRSQFFLADELSYIDLLGNVNVDVKMKQDVALKIAEPFVFRVRGTLDKPKYGFKPFN